MEIGIFDTKTQKWITKLQSSSGVLNTHEKHYLKIQEEHQYDVTINNKKAIWLYIFKN